MKRNLLFSAAFALILIPFIIYKKTGDVNPHTKSFGVGVKLKTNEVVIPRVTNKQMNAMKFFTPSVTEGMLVYKTYHNPGIYYFKGSKWVRLKALWHR